MQETTQQKTKPQVELLAKLWNNFENPPKIMGDKYALGSRNFTKLIMFAINVQLTNDDIDFWCHQFPKRQENEAYESYKQRMKFTKFLDKYRPYIYNYNMYENVVGGKKHSTKRAKKVMKSMGL